MDKITAAKIELYRLVLRKSVRKLTEDEIDLMYILARDPKIQEVLEAKLDKKVSILDKIISFLA